MVLSVRKRCGISLNQLLTRGEVPELVSVTQSKCQIIGDIKNSLRNAIHDLMIYKYMKQNHISRGTKCVACFSFSLTNPLRLNRPPVSLSGVLTLP